MAPKPDVVWDAAEEIIPIVDVQDCAEAVLEVVSPALVKVDAVELEP